MEVYISVKDWRGVNMGVWSNDSPGWEISDRYTTKERTYLKKTVKYDNCNLTVHRPVRTEAEEEAYIKNIKDATELLFKAYYRNQVEKERQAAEEKENQAQ